jgi:hypothetical protein
MTEMISKSLYVARVAIYQAENVLEGIVSLEIISRLYVKIFQAACVFKPRMKVLESKIASELSERNSASSKAN